MSLDGLKDVESVTMGLEESKKKKKKFLYLNPEGWPRVIKSQRKYLSKVGPWVVAKPELLEVAGVQPCNHCRS